MVGHKSFKKINSSNVWTTKAVETVLFTINIAS